MGEQNRRATELEPSPGAAASDPSPKPPAARAVQNDHGERAVSIEADERQTAKMAPAGASPGEGADDETIG